MKRSNITIVVKMAEYVSKNGAQPFLKWAGGKGQLLAQYAPYFPTKTSGTYHEPFLGSGAVFFYLHGRNLYRHYLLSDTNSELINLFLVVRDKPEPLLSLLRNHKEQHARKHYYSVREMDRDGRWQNVDDVVRAARMLYLNKTCFNGLWRVNSQGYFNVPMGQYKNPDIYNPERIMKASEALQSVCIEKRGFATVLDYAQRGDFIYFDPPYIPLNTTSNFTEYSPDSFSVEDQKRLAAVYSQLHEMGCFVMLSNSDTELVEELYRGFHIRKVEARRAINSKPGRRGAIKEVLITNYPKPRRRK